MTTAVDSSGRDARLPDALGFAAALAERGMACGVEARERLAVLFTSEDWPALAQAAERRTLHGLATQYGFTHVALELDADEDGAAADDAERAP